MTDRYLVTLKGRSGLYAQRAVPKHLQTRLGTKLWRKKAGNTLTEARRFLPGFLAWTEEQIRGLHPANPERLTKEEDRLLARGRQTNEILEFWPSIEWDEVEMVPNLPPVPLLTSEDLIKKAKAIKSPASGTVREWQNCFYLFTQFSKYKYPLSATREDAGRLRDHLLTTKKPSTVKKIIRYLRSHWQLCID